MLLGYNHNIPYNGLVFHIQTEDSGTKKPHITTLLYREGVILCSQKTSYADILAAENIEEIVEDLMKEQHKNMLRRLKSGEFDQKIGIKAQPQPPQKDTAATEETPQPFSAALTPDHAKTKQRSIAPSDTTLDSQPSRPDAVQKNAENLGLDATIRAFFGISGSAK